MDHLELEDMRVERRGQRLLELDDRLVGILAAKIEPRFRLLRVDDALPTCCLAPCLLPADRFDLLHGGAHPYASELDHHVPLFVGIELELADLRSPLQPHAVPLTEASAGRGLFDLRAEVLPCLLDRLAHLLDLIVA